MSILTTIKQLAIRTGMYRPVRKLERSIRPNKRRDFQGNVALYQSLFRPNSLCFDIGANIGMKSDAMLQAGARVISFEPNPLVIPELRACCSHHPNWSLVETALGSGAAITTLYARESSGQSSLAQEWEGKTIAKYHVPVVTLDSAIKCFGTPAFCKIDVEGWELEVLKGLTTIIPQMSFEFHLSESDIKKTVTCLERLAQFGEIQINITPDELTQFYFPDWIPLDQFLKRFPGNLEESMDYGDIFIRYEIAKSDHS